MGRHMGAQGRTEAIALVVLEYLHKLGYLRRFKEQPFQTDENEFGAEIVPDFLAEGHRPKELYILEMKTARFLTVLKQKQLDSNREKFASFGLEYHVWTDHHPLTLSVRHHILDMRRFGQHTPPTERERLAAFVKDKGVVNVEQLFSTGFNLNALYAAAWSGQVHFSLMHPMSGTTCVQSSPVDNLWSIFFQQSEGNEDWWNNLPAC